MSNGKNEKMLVQRNVPGGRDGHLKLERHAEQIKLSDTRKDGQKGGTETHKDICRKNATEIYR